MRVVFKSAELKLQTMEDYLDKLPSYSIMYLEKNNVFKASDNKYLEDHLSLSIGNFISITVQKERLRILKDNENFLTAEYLEKLKEVVSKEDVSNR